MAVSGLVIELGEDATHAAAAWSVMSADSRLTLGEPQGRRIPAVLEVADACDAMAAHDWLRTLPGVLAVQVVFVEVDEKPGPDSGPGL